MKKTSFRFWDVKDIPVVDEWSLRLSDRLSGLLKS